MSQGYEAASANWRTLIQEPVQPNRIGNGLHARVVWVEMIAAVVGRQVLRGMGRIVRSSVHVDERVASAFIAAEKCVDPFARDFFLRRPIIGALKRRERGAQELHVVAVRIVDQLLDSSDQRFRGRWWLGRSKIVDGIVGEDDPAHAGLREHIAVEARQGALACAGNQQTVPADSGIEHTDAEPGINKPARKIVGPAAVGVRR